jgi:SAM-dependent methyltransferase
MDAHEAIYREHADPWGYYSAGEQAKYRHTLAVARRWKPRPRRVLETACSLGHMTRLLADYADEVWAYDISPTAVERARDRCRDVPPERLHIDVGDALAPSYPPDSFDVVFIGDVGMKVHQDLDGAIIRQALRLLRADGVLVLVDNMKPFSQDEYVAFVERQGAEILERIYVCDRYWARFRTAVKYVLPPALARRMTANEAICATLATLGRWRGPQGSKHFGVVAKRRAEPAAQPR